ncbi:MAG: NAD-dependent epimerase/dehydratase family protein [Sporichthyaceae bacterium]|nr:NAD-dependent epimerase/dehydratase family protein [Sporichthyaceae bacterium]
MRLLVIGGTAFLGRHTVEEALRRGYQVTTFNRGLSGPDRPDVQAIHGDRSKPADLDQLAPGTWDAVVDTCGFVPAVVGESARLLKDRAGWYGYVSSLSAHPAWPAAPVTPSSPIHESPPDAGPDDGDYGTLKAGCERAVEQSFADRALLVRAGLLLGPYENVGRLPWWLRRVAAGGQVLAPGDPNVPMQLIDARDLANWMLDSAEAGQTGPFAATGPAGNTTMGRWLGDCVEATGSGAELVWVPDEFLLEHDVETWSELPLWMPTGPDTAGTWTVDVSRAQAAGLRSRPVRDTVRDTWAWLRDGGTLAPPRDGSPFTMGIDPDKEKRVLAEWASAKPVA